MTKTILVTGGTGYIGGEIIALLLDRGHSVRTTVRNKSASAARFSGRWPNAGERLKVFEADLMDDAGWAAATEGCDAVAHVASPLPVSVPRDEDELIVPAREGTLRALRFAQEAGVRHFVQTSSNAAISYGHPRSRVQFDERDWTNLDAPGIQPYIKSKTVAERAARDWVAAHAPEMAFCSVNPVLVLGPVASADFSASVEVVRRLLTGGVPMIPNVGFSIVDVRDVAMLHVLALEAEASVIRDERFAASTEFYWMADVARVLRVRLGNDARKVPARRMPDWLLRLMALASRDIRQLAGEIGSRKALSGQHANDVLGWTTRPAEDTIVDTARSLIAQGIVEV
jgi:nucleoside-diphosphate-sugar epimerase